MPRSTSFPSGHSASAFAFASAASAPLPGMGGLLQMAAAMVAYSRVHTGVHYPVDVVVGSLIGSAIAPVTTAALDRLRGGSSSAGGPSRSPRARRTARAGPGR